MEAPLLLGCGQVRADVPLNRRKRAESSRQVLDVHAWRLRSSSTASTRLGCVAAGVVRVHVDIRSLACGPLQAVPVCTWRGVRNETEVAVVSRVHMAWR